MPKSPTPRLIAGLVVTLLLMAASAGYTLHSVHSMRQLQSDLIDRNRKASLQLIRIQSDLNSLALGLDDMKNGRNGYPLIGWDAQLTRIRENLDDALRIEALLAKGRRSDQLTTYLSSTFAHFWRSVDQMFERAKSGSEPAARAMIASTLEPQRNSLAALIARLLVANNEEEEKAAVRVNTIYSNIERNVFLFLFAAGAGVLLTSIAIIRANRALFEQLAELSDQRSELARQLITTQETTLRSVSRDLHDEFGQVLTAIGVMLRRASRSAPSSEFHAQITEVAQIAQQTLDKVRSLSQSLQPVILEEQGLDAAIEWYLTRFEHQTGIRVSYQRPAVPATLAAGEAIHVFRVLQEALNNVAKHAGVEEVSVKFETWGNGFQLEVRDRGSGIAEQSGRGIGLLAMRERAELIGGEFSLTGAPEGGTVVRLRKNPDARDNSLVSG